MQYDEDGFLPEAMLNYLARLGWSHGDEEMFTMAAVRRMVRSRPHHAIAAPVQSGKTELAQPAVHQAGRCRRLAELAQAASCRRDGCDADARAATRRSVMASAQGARRTRSKNWPTRPCISIGRSTPARRTAGAAPHAGNHAGAGGTRRHSCAAGRMERARPSTR